MDPTDLTGLIPDTVGAELAALAAAVPEGQCVVEVGSFKGKSTAFLATGAKRSGAAVFAVDPWDLPGNPYGKHAFNVPAVRAEFEQQLRAARLWSRVTPIQGFSADVAASWDGPPIGLLFIDGDHREAGVRGDIEAWTPHLADGAVIALDDLDTKPNPGVRIVADEMVAAGYRMEVRADRLAVLR